VHGTARRWPASSAHRRRRRSTPEGALRWRSLLGFRRADALWLRDRLFPCVLLACVSAACYFLLKSPLFVVHNVRVVGAPGALTRDIVQRAGIADQDLFAINPAQVQRRIAVIPDLSDVKVRLRLPNTVTIQVSAYESAAVWVAGGQNYLITTSGMVIKPGDAPNLFHITDGVAASLRHGDSVRVDNLRAAFALRGLLAEQRLDAQQFAFVDPRSLRITSPAGWQATFDATGDLALQTRVLAALLAHGITFQSADLRYGANPYYR